MQEWWMKNKDENCRTIMGPIDTLHPSIMCQKLKLYGSDYKTVSWISSF